MPFKDKLLDRISKKPSTASELKAFFKTDKKVSKSLVKLINKGKIKKEDGKYVVAKPKRPTATVEAIVVKHTGRYAFATPTQGGDDIYIHSSNLAGALVGDKISIGIKKRDGKISGKVISIIEPCDRVTGQVVLYKNQPALLVDGYSGEYLFKIKKTKLHLAEIGEQVAAQIISRGEGGVVCEITRRFGDIDSAMTSAKSIIYNSGMRTRFNAATKEEAAKISVSSIDPSENRVDLRDVLIFTIDGADTKDIDDAVSLQKSENGWTLGVHIADVSHYVALGSPTETEAFLRQYSFYYPNNVIPMLPAELSNGICSLSSGVERLAFSCIIELSSKGEILAGSFVKTIICSRFQGVYSEVNSILDSTADEKTKAKYRGSVSTLKNMQKLATILNKNRNEAGSIDFNIAETSFDFDSHDNVIGVSPKKRGASERIIEEFMLLANNFTATVAKDIGLPIIYRVHEPPNVERLAALQAILSSSNAAPYKFDPSTVKSLDVSNLLHHYDNTPLSDFVNNSVLRSMSKAEYSIRPIGHFGLATTDYAHFTSPIRRYTDLLNHHILSEFGKKRPTGEILKKYISIAVRTVAQANSQEQLFLKSERQIEDCFRAEGMRKHVGEIFEGAISGVTDYAMFVKLDNTAEGRISIADISDEYLLYEENYRLYTVDNSKQFKIGDRIRVKIVAANVATGTIDLIPER